MELVNLRITKLVWWVWSAVVIGICRVWIFLGSFHGFHLLSTSPFQDDNPSKKNEDYEYGPSNADTDSRLRATTQSITLVIFLGAACRNKIIAP